MTVVAKMICDGIEDASPDAAQWRRVRLRPVYASGPDDPNASWSRHTPSGSVDLMITNPAAFQQFVSGREYLVTFEEAAPAA